MFDFISVPGFLSCTICSVLNLYVVLRHLAKYIEVLHIFSRGAPNMHPVKRHSLVTSQTNQLLCCARAETEHTRVSKLVSELSCMTCGWNHRCPRRSQTIRSTQMSALTARVLLRYDQRLITGQIPRAVFTRSRCVAPHSQTGLRPVKLVWIQALIWAFFPGSVLVISKKKEKKKKGRGTLWYLFIQRECWTSDRKSTVVTCMLSLAGTQNSEQETAPLFTEGLGGVKKKKGKAWLFNSRQPFLHRHSNVSFWSA